MRFKQAFKLTSYLLLFAGFVSAYVSGAVGLPLLLAYSLALTLGYRYGELEAPQWFQLLSFLLLVGLFAVDSLFLSGFIPATVHLLFLTSLIKVFSRKGDRDFLLLYFISFAFILVASTFAVSILFLAALLFYILLAILTFLLFESKPAYQENQRAYFSLKGYILFSILTTALIVLVSVPLFLAIPRSSAGFFRHSGPRNLLSGFSDEVSLGDMGPILKNPQVVMRVQVNRPPESLPPDLKWRGIALDYYNGETWFNSSGLRRRVSARLPGGGLLVAGRRRIDEFQVRQTFSVLPFSSVVFGAPDMIMVSGITAYNDSLVRDANGSFRLARTPRRPFRYTVDSDVVDRRQRMAEVSAGEIPEFIGKRYLQLPRLNSRVRELAFEITSGRPAPLDKALAIETYLRRHFTYSLDNGSAQAPDPLYNFLFVRRSGHCEYFATAQAILMRIAGIPARVINGFQRGEYNSWSNYFIVRQSNAHSWVEGYFPGAGWVEFDATPPAVANDAPYFFRAADQILDTLDVFWTEVVTFDQLKQWGLFRLTALKVKELGDWIRALPVRAEDVYRSTRLRRALQVQTLRILLGGFILLAGTLLLIWKRPYWSLFLRKRILKHSGSRIAAGYFSEMLGVLSRRGFSMRTGETPAEFSRRVQRGLETAIPAQITDFYYGNRFGNLPLHDRDLSQIYRWLEELKRFPRRGRRAEF